MIVHGKEWSMKSIWKFFSSHERFIRWNPSYKSPLGMKIANALVKSVKNQPILFQAEDERVVAVWSELLKCPVVLLRRKR